MNVILPYAYGFLAGAIAGAIFGVLWGRKHPSVAAKLAVIANEVKAKV
jgi:hypothetical protein